MAAASASAPVRGTQLLVEHMGEVFRRPSLIAIEVGWRWLFGIPFLLVCWQQAQQILAAFPLESSGFNSLDTQNPWVAAVQLAKRGFVLRAARAGRAALAAAGGRAWLGGAFRAWAAIFC